MGEESHRTPPDEVDMVAAEQAIRRAGVQAFAAFIAAGAASVLVLPGLVAFPLDLAQRLAFGVQAVALVLIWVLFGVGYVSTTRRFSPRDIGGAASGPPSERLAIPLAFLQNTLEQAVLAAGLFLALAVVLPVSGPPLIVVAVVFFWVGRILFLRGYARGVRGRALGMCLTVMPAIVGYPIVPAVIAWRILSG